MRLMERLHQQKNLFVGLHVGYSGWFCNGKVCVDSKETRIMQECTTGIDRWWLNYDGFDQTTFFCLCSCPVLLYLSPTKFIVTTFNILGHMRLQLVIIVL